MDQHRWSAVNRIFHAALEVHPSQRPSVISAESNGDAELEAEVQLLLEADSEAGSYLDSPLLPHDSYLSTASPLSPGDVLCGRFRIVREIAEGGMGHIFEAFDSELAVRVALKVVRSEIASDPEAISRFRQEVRLARRITHPNICRTFDIERETRLSNGQRSELIFLTMEFLEGETLATRLKRDGPLPPAVALEVARQIAAALDAAHVLGIVHRDMKPANIMLVPAESAPHAQPRIVVTDFGLARVDPLRLAAGLSSFSHSGQLIGTLSYMAPEQLEGGTVSPATDIYAFGLILFEILTGQRAFPASNLLSGIAERLRGSVPPLESLGDSVPAAWRRTILACLQVNPSARPRDASAVVGMLGDPARRILPRLSPTKLNVRRHLVRATLIAASLLIALALLFGGVRLYRSRADSGVAPGALVYLTQVKNETGERSLDTLTELIQSGLAQSVQVNLLDQDRVGDILQQMTRAPETVIDPATAREIAMRSGAARVIFATVTGDRGKYALNVNIQQPDNTPTRYREHWTRSFAWQNSPSTANSSTIPGDLLAQVRSASDWIRHEVGESANDIARLDTPPEDVTTSNWDALEDYMSALRLKAAERPTEAVVTLRNATRLDPDFALAYGVLADVQLTLHHENEGFEAYRKALDPSLERRLSRRERDRIAGMYAVDNWDFSAAVDVFRDYQTFYPNDLAGWLYPAYPLMMLDRDDEAIGDLKRAHALAPESPNVLESLASAEIDGGELDQAGAHLARARSVSPVVGDSGIPAALDILSSHYDQADSLLASQENSSDLRQRSRAFEMRADLAAERGQYKQALQLLEQGMKEDLTQGNPSAQSSKLAARASIEAALGDFAGCAADLRAAVPLNPSPELILMVETVLGRAIQLAPAAQSLPLRHQMIDLTLHLPKGDFGPITDILRLRSRAEASLARGEVDAALKQFRDLSAIDAPAAPREYLGRALLAAAARRRVAAATADLRRQAMQAFSVVALHPNLVWQITYMYPPGFVSEQMLAFVRLADSLGSRTPDVQSVRLRLAALRGSATGAPTAQDPHAEAQPSTYLPPLGD